MATESLKSKTKKGLVWSTIERFSVQAVHFLVMLVMARMLDPSDYGLIGLLAVFIAISQALIDCGFSQALIRKTDRTDVDTSTVFYFNIVVGVVMYLVCFVSAPWVARFYEMPLLTQVMRVVSLTFLVNSLVIVQRAELTAKIDFKTQAKASFLAVVVSGVVGIYMAYAGFGVWSLVWQQMSSVVINAVVLWIYAKWSPKWKYSWQSFRELFGFGSKLMLSSLIDVTYNNIRPLIIGKIFSAGDLGHYSRAHQFGAFPSSSITGVIQRVTYPLLVEVKEDNARLERIYRKLLRTSAFVIFPLMTGLAGVSRPFVMLTIGQKWMLCAELLEILCFSMMWYPIHAINLNLLQVKGRSDLFLKLEVIKKITGLTVLAVSIPFGLKAMCYGTILSCFISLFINTYYTGKLINVGFAVQMRDLAHVFLLSCAMFAAVAAFCFFIDNLYIQLFGGIIVGAALYVGGACLFRFAELKDALSMIRKK